MARLEGFGFSGILRAGLCLGKGLWGKLPLQGSAETKDCGTVLGTNSFSGRDGSVSGNLSSLPL